jgi:hypothetical protein
MAVPVLTDLRSKVLDQDEGEFTAKLLYAIDALIGALTHRDGQKTTWDIIPMSFPPIFDNLLDEGAKGLDHKDRGLFDNL